jgi:hypothetical protein
MASEGDEVSIVDIEAMLCRRPVLTLQAKHLHRLRSLASCRIQDASNHFHQPLLRLQMLEDRHQIPTKKRPQSQRDSPKIWFKRRHDLNSSVAQINDGPTLFRLGGNQTGCLRAMLLLDVDVVSSHGARENTLATGQGKGAVSGSAGPFSGLVGYVASCGPMSLGSGNGCRF